MKWCSTALIDCRISGEVCVSCISVLLLISLTTYLLHYNTSLYSTRIAWTKTTVTFRQKYQDRHVGHVTVISACCHGLIDTLILADCRSYLLYMSGLYPAEKILMYVYTKNKLIVNSQEPLGKNSSREGEFCIKTEVVPWRFLSRDFLIKTKRPLVRYRYR